MKTLHQYLVEVRTNPQPNEGICGCVRDLLFADMGGVGWRKLPEGFENRYLGFAREMRSLFQLWPEYSGHPCYPVSGDSIGFADYPDSAFHESEETLSLWSGLYGEARKRLLDYLIEATK